MPEPKAPFFLVGSDGDIQVAHTLLAAEGEMEPPELNDGYWSLFDSEGKWAELAVDAWEVKVTGWHTGKDVELRQALASFANQHGWRVATAPSSPEFIRDFVETLNTQRHLNSPTRRSLKAVFRLLANWTPKKSSNSGDS